MRSWRLSISDAMQKYYHRHISGRAEEDSGSGSGCLTGGGEPQVGVHGGSDPAASTVPEKEPPVGADGSEVIAADATDRYFLTNCLPFFCWTSSASFSL
jgi:hypothetical protein